MPPLPIGSELNHIRIGHPSVATSVISLTDVLLIDRGTTPGIAAFKRPIISVASCDIIEPFQKLIDRFPIVYRSIHRIPNILQQLTFGSSYRKSYVLNDALTFDVAIGVEVDFLAEVVEG